MIEPISQTILMFPHEDVPNFGVSNWIVMIIAVNISSLIGYYGVELVKEAFK